MTTCQFTPSIFNLLTSPPNIRGSGNGRKHLARGEAKRDEKRKEERKKSASADFSLLISCANIPTLDINILLSQVLGTVGHGVGH
jgi:hypothetical protein